MSAFNMTHICRKSVLTQVCLYALAKWGIIDLVMVCCLINTKDLFECWLVIVKMVKIQFRGSGLYKELEGINPCNIFWNSSLNWHFLMFTLCFDVRFSSVKLASLSSKIIRNTMFWWLTSQSWCHKAGAWEVLPITLCQAWQHTIDWLTAICCAVWQWKQWQLKCEVYQQKLQKYTQNKAIHEKLHHQFVNENIKKLVW